MSEFNKHSQGFEKHNESFSFNELLTTEKFLVFVEFNEIEPIQKLRPSLLIFLKGT